MQRLAESGWLEMRKLLQKKGIHWLATRFGWRQLRSLSFDERYKSGTWNFSGESAELVHLVESYCDGGDLLMLGCGRAGIVGCMKPGMFRSFVGVDLSPEAIAVASKQSNDQVRFEVGDMENHVCAQRYDVILFADSLYYVSRFRRKRFLQTVRRQLTDRGVIIVAIAQPGRYACILEMIRRNFSIDLDRPLEAGNRHVIIFR